MKLVSSLFTFLFNTSQDNNTSTAYHEAKVYSHATYLTIPTHDYLIS